MKHTMHATTHLALAGLVLGLVFDHAQAQEAGPGQGGSVLRDPSAPLAAPQSAPTGSYVEDLIRQPSSLQPGADQASKFLQPYEEKPDINRDIQVTKDMQPWMIMVQAYTGPEASIMARQLVTELRAAYKLPAYTFNYGAEKMRQEHARVKDIAEKQRDFATKNGLPLDQRIRIRTVRIEEQVGVLITGYPTEEAARRALDNIHKLKPLDPSKVMLDKKVLYGDDSKASKADKLQEAYVNPFLGAHVAHNPTIKQERPAEWDKPDMGLLRRLNADEPFSLLHCKKPFTLVVKDFKTPAMLQSQAESGSFLSNLFGGKSGQRVDAAATSAHNLAELLRQAKLDAYVLHTKFYSIVCVGGFDSVEDPGLRNMTELIESKVLPGIAPLFPAAPNQSVAQAKVVPMRIPR